MATPRTERKRMTPEESVARHESDCAFLRSVGQALEAAAQARRDANQPPLTAAEAAAIVAAL